MIYHKNFHFHYLEFPVFTICYLQYYSIIILCKSPLHYYYIFFTFILHLLKNGNFSGRNWKFNFQYMEIKLEIYGNGIGNIWKSISRKWKYFWEKLEISIFFQFESENLFGVLSKGTSPPFSMHVRAKTEGRIIRGLWFFRGCF